MHVHDRTCRDARGKLGETILFASEFNRHEVFAASGDNFATLDEADAGTNFQDAFDLYYERGNPSSDERRVVVHADHVYGSARPVERLLCDVAHDDSDWAFSVTTGVGSPHSLRSIAYLSVRAITSDFDPSTITWTSATTGGGALSYSATVETLEIGYWEALLWGDNDTLSCNAKLATLIYLPGPLASDHAWNCEDAIYGFELRVDLSTGDASDSMRWLGDLDEGDPCCFVVRP
jgi:hypothetical protein